MTTTLDPLETAKAAIGALSEERDRLAKRIAEIDALMGGLSRATPRMRLPRKARAKNIAFSDALDFVAKHPGSTSLELFHGLGYASRTAAGQALKMMLQRGLCRRAPVMNHGLVSGRPAYQYFPATPNGGADT